MVIHKVSHIACYVVYTHTWEGANVHSVKTSLIIYDGIVSDEIKGHSGCKAVSIDFGA